MCTQADDQEKGKSNIVQAKVTQLIKNRQMHNHSRRIMTKWAAMNNDLDESSLQAYIDHEKFKILWRAKDQPKFTQIQLIST